MTFRYEAVRSDGHAVRGRLDAASGADAAAVLSRRGLFPVRVAPAEVHDAWSRRRPPTRMMATAMESLASLLEVGVPLQTALQVTQRATGGPLRASLSRVEARVREGSPLSRALDAERGLFSPVTVGLVRAGERGIGLVGALSQAAAQLERQDEIEARIRAALTYPAVLVVVGGLSIALLVLVVVPRFAALLSDVGAGLPSATRILLGASALVHAHAGLLFGMLVASVGAAAVFARKHSALWDTWALDLPVLGPIRHGLATARVGRTLGALLESGTPMLTALEAALDAVGDNAVASRLRRARERVAEGWSLGAALEAGSALTPGTMQLIGIGERSSRLPELLGRAASMEERLAERRLRVLVSLLEPALILCFAVVVAFVAAALLQGLYSLRPGAP
jgi:general secretion pathway protein F